jgi:hypothetical protein
VNSVARADLSSLNLDKFKLYRRFKKNKGKEKRIKERPLITEEHKRARVEFAEQILMLRAAGAIICYLDEKWFYIFTQWHHAKHLP